MTPHPTYCGLGRPHGGIAERRGRGARYVLCSFQCWLMLFQVPQLCGVHVMRRCTGWATLSTYNTGGRNRTLSDPPAATVFIRGCLGFHSCFLSYSLQLCVLLMRPIVNVAAYSETLAGQATATSPNSRRKSPSRSSIRSRPQNPAMWPLTARSAPP